MCHSGKTLQQILRPKGCPAGRQGTLSLARPGQGSFLQVEYTVAKTLFISFFNLYF